MTCSGIARAVAVLLAFVGTQLAPSPVLLASTIGLLASTIGLLARSHAHAHLVSIVSEEGHLDLVLSHRTGGERERSHAAPDDRAGAYSERDHVFHLTISDAATHAGRRASLAHAFALASPIFALASSSTGFAQHPQLEPRAPRADIRKSVVLRL